MIVGNYKTEADKLLAQLEQSEFQFFLTGSRFFGTNNPNSDYDLFCEENPKIEQFLTDLGFVSLKDNFYHGEVTDINTAKVFRSLLCVPSIDVQLVKLVDLKVELQTYLLANKIRVPITKSVQRTFWDAEYAKFLLAKQRAERGILNEDLPIIS